MAPELQTTVLGDHIDRLYRAAWALCGSREDAEDLVQETFAKVLAKRRELESDDPVPYLLGVLRNVFVSGLRTRSRRPQAAEVDDEAIGRLAAPASDRPDHRAEAREVFSCVAALPADYRDALVAVDVAGLTYAEAAEALGVPTGTIMSRLYRGRGRVADALSA